jgi:ABC-2 type transport system ATP-binding protein
VRDVDGSVVVYVPDGQRAIARIILALDQAAIAVEEVSLAQPSLDDVFLRTTGHHLEPGAEREGRSDGGQP